MLIVACRCGAALLLGRPWHAEADTIRVELFGPCIHSSDASYTRACKGIRKAIKQRIDLNTSSMLSTGACHKHIGGQLAIRLCCIEP